MKIKLLVAIIAVLGFSTAGVVHSNGQTKVTVKFRAGASSGTYNGSLRGRNFVDYYLRASGGQTLTVKLTRRSGEYPYFNVLKVADGEAIADDAREATEWSGSLPETRQYVVRVYVAKAARLANRASSYRISFKIE